MQEVSANVALILDPKCAIALDARATCRVNRGDDQGAKADYTMLGQLGVDVQQVYITLLMSQSLILAVLEQLVSDHACTALRSRIEHVQSA